MMSTDIYIWFRDIKEIQEKILEQLNEKNKEVLDLKYMI